MIDGIVILNDGRVGNFRFYGYQENEIANGMNGEIDDFDRKCPKQLIANLKENGLLKDLNILDCGS